jgi:ribosomal protein L11 methyltransferase
MSDWTEVKIKVNADDVDKAGDIAMMVVPYGIYIEDYRDLEQQAWDIAHIDLIDEDLLKKDRNEAFVHIYISPEENPLEAVAFLRERYTAEGIENEIDLTACRNEDWENNWKQYYKPFCVGQRLFVCPSWEEAETPAGRTLLTMDPASSFGTGSHATTRMCMEQLDALQLDDANILDVGCGSGILACTALLLGGKHALACDIEENAMVVTKENMEKNDVAPARYTTRCGDLLSDPVLADELQSKGPYDVILANIVADVLMAMRDYLLRWVKADGRIILSGIIAERAAEVRASFEAGGAEIIETRIRDGWVMYCVKRK